TYAHMFTDSVPDNAIVATFCDNSSHIVGYEHYANGVAPNIYFTFGMPLNVYLLQPKDGWTLNLKRAFLKDFIFRPQLNPLNLSRTLSEEEIKTRPFFTEFAVSEEGDMYSYCLPHGFLLQVLERKTTDAEVLAADVKFKSEHPELFEKPKARINRMSSEAFAYAHLRRALFFLKRKMYQHSIEDLEIAMAWSPKNPQIMFPYGAALEEVKDYQGAEMAYLDCIDSMPEFVNARQNLALLYLYAGREDLAMKFAKEELILSKGAKNTKQLVDLLEKRAASKK
ncbi:MAG: hypothetical protein WCI55_16730, partial [Armatimonadota bacterium]